MLNQITNAEKGDICFCCKAKLKKGSLIVEFLTYILCPYCFEFARKEKPK